MASEFKVKDEVFVESVRKLGTVVGCPKPGWYDVVVNGMRIQCPASGLKARADLSKATLKLLKNIAQPKSGSAKNPPSRPARLDLHGMRVEEAMREVEKAIDRAIIDGHQRMEIVHGIGAGKIRAALHAYLKALSVIETYKVDDLNAGVTWVYF